MSNKVTKFPKLLHRGNYFKVRNTHVFIGFMNIPDLSILDTINTSIKTKIHFFLCDENDLSDYFFIALEKLLLDKSKQCKVIIHIPDEIKELKFLYDQKIGEMASKGIFICESKPVSFKFGDYESMDTNILDVIYEDGYINVRANIFKQKCLSKERSVVIQNVVQKYNPEEFKEEIIGRFKATTPLGILKSFKSEEDIWNFITMDKDWAVSKKSSKMMKDFKPYMKKESFAPDSLRGQADTIVKGVLAAIKGELDPDDEERN